MNNLAEKIRREENVFAMDESSPAKEAPALRSFFADSVYPALVRVLAGALIVALCLWMAAGTADILLALGKIATSGWATPGWAKGAERIVVDSLIILALLEVVRTLQSYIKLGRVRVTFILDAALVVLIGELIGLWFREYSPAKILLGLGVIVTLVVLRSVTAKFSPEPSH